MSGPTGLSIGALSQATGIPAATLRTWERRYGVPACVRTDGGHRVYPAEAVDHLRLVARALSLGHRPAQALALSPDALEALLDRPAPPLAAEADWAASLRELDGPALASALRRGWARRGALPFLLEELAPFLGDVGARWRRGQIDVLHEHFATERLRGFLVEHWQPLSDGNTGPVAVLGNLPGERHDLGLHMVATVLALAGWRVVFLGADTPIPSLLGATRRGARALFVSVSEASEPVDAARLLDEVADGLAPGVTLAVGGGGAPEGRWTRFVDLGTLSDWATELAR